VSKETNLRGESRSVLDLGRVHEQLELRKMKKHQFGAVCFLDQKEKRKKHSHDSPDPPGPQALGQQQEQQQGRPQVQPISRHKKMVNMSNTETAATESHLLTLACLAGRAETTAGSSRPPLAAALASAPTLNSDRNSSSAVHIRGGVSV
jgi:hypothetical protein